MLNMKYAKLTEKDVIQMLHAAGIRPSIHRIGVLLYVANAGTHPTADELYSDVQTLYPSVSRTTIYNALHTLVSGKLVRELEIDSGNRHYDLALREPHSHFECSRCGRIFDMAIPAGLEKVADAGFTVDSVDLYLKGLCPECAANQ